MVQTPETVFQSPGGFSDDFLKTFALIVDKCFLEGSDVT